MTSSSARDHRNSIQLLADTLSILFSNLNNMPTGAKLKSACEQSLSDSNTNKQQYNFEKGFEACLQR